MKKLSAFTAMKPIITTIFVFGMVSLLITACIRVPPTSPFPTSAALTTQLNEAKNVLGVPVPLPTYLPAGYEISNIETADPKIVMLHLTRNAGTSADEITFQAQWRRDALVGIKLPGTRVNITGSSNTFEQGVIVDRGDHNELWWDWIQDPSTNAHYEFVISASKQVSSDELVKIGRSVQLPPSIPTTTDGTTSATPALSQSPWPNTVVYSDPAQPINVNVSDQFVIGYEQQGDMFPIFRQIYDTNSISLLDQKGVSYSTNGLPNDSGIVWFLFKALQPSYSQITIEHHLHITEALHDQEVFTVAIGGVTPTSPFPTSATLQSKLDEAKSALGVPVPLPTYLPDGYAISQIEIAEQNTVVFHITKNTVPDNQIPAAANEITLQVQWRPGGVIGIKLPGQRVNITGSADNYEEGVINNQDGHNDLWWDWRSPLAPPGTGAHFEFVCSASTIVPTDELVKIARSVRLP